MAATTDALLERLASAPEQTGLFLDFDGVLAPIVSRPEDATLLADTRAELERLARRYALVSVVSGRAADDVRARIGVDQVVVVGSHGLELDPQAERWRARIAEFAAEAGWPETELKGLTVSFHFRNAPDERQALRTLERVAENAVEAGLVARFGRKVLEVLPPLDSNKGTAVRTLVTDAGLTRALVAGDDTTDLDSFRAVDGLDVAVRVAVVSDEGPSALRDAADVVVETTGEFLELLRRL